MNQKVSKALRQLFSAVVSLFLIAGCLSTDKEEEAAQVNREEQVEQMLSEWQQAKGSIERLVELEGDFKLLVTAISEASTLPNSAPPLETEESDVVEEESEDDGSGIKVIRPEGYEPPPEEETPTNNTGSKRVVTEAANPTGTFSERSGRLSGADDEVRVIRAEGDTPLAPSQLFASEDAPTTLGGESSALPASRTRSQRERTVGPATRIEAVNRTPLEYDPMPTLVSNDQSCKNSAQDIGGDIALHLMSISDFDNVQKGWETLRSKFSDILCNKRLLVKNVVVEGQQYFSLRVGSFSYTQAMQTCEALKARGQYCSLTQYTGRPITEYD